MPSGPAGILDEVDRRWSSLCDTNPAYFDGRVCHVLGVSRNGHGGAVLHVMDCAYRFLAVQDDEFDLGVRALGVKGITSHHDRVLLGLRSPTVAFYRNMWEFAPGGSVTVNDHPAETVLQELHEETSLTASHDPTAVAVLFDPVLRCWEIVYRIAAAQGSARACPSEYTQLRWCAHDELPQGLSPIAQHISALL